MLRNHTVTAALRLRITALAAAASFAFMLTPAHAAEPSKKDIKVTFAVSGTLLYNGSDPAKLKVTNNKTLGGEVGLFNTLGLGPFACKINVGSYLKNKRLHLQCDSEGLTDVFTFAGRLNPLTGKGKGTVSESLTGEKGTWIATKTN
jgi:hypothetical protein